VVPLHAEKSADSDGGRTGTPVLAKTGNAAGREPQLTTNTPPNGIGAAVV
jgi:hypothetical protein